MYSSLTDSRAVPGQNVESDSESVLSLVFVIGLAVLVTLVVKILQLPLEPFSPLFFG